MKELVPLAALSAILISLHPGLPPDTLTQNPLREDKAAVIRDDIKTAGLRMVGRNRLKGLRNGHMPEGINLGLLSRVELLYPETR